MNKNVTSINSRRSQIDAVRQHLQRGESITPLQALHLYGVLRLSSIIHRLRREFPINTTHHRDPKHDKQWAEYSCSTTEPMPGNRGVYVYA